MSRRKKAIALVRNRWKTVAGAAVIIAFAAAAAYAYAPTRSDRALADVTRTIESTSAEPEVFAYLYGNIETLLPEIGINGAIEAVRFAVSKHKLTFAHCHAVLHTVGHVGYRIANGDLEELAQHIDPMCQGAYDHGVEAEIAAAGEAKFSELIAWCEVRTAGAADSGGPYCYHGAGHEFMRESLGNIETALSWCDKIDPSRDPSNCWAGVFSEFGALSMGLDSDTGELIPGELLVTNPFTPPLEFCENLPSKYRESCVSQLTKTVVNIEDPMLSAAACTRASYEFETQKTCMRFFGFFYFDQRLNDAAHAEAPDAVFTLAPPLRQAFIEGAMQAFLEANQSGLARDARPFCGEFPAEDDKVFCLSAVL